MVRTFNGRQSEESYNSELYKLYEVLKPILDVPIDPGVGPATSREGALWLDRSNGGEMKFFSEGSWKVIFQDRFRLVSEILSANQPEHPMPGQLWLNDGILMYYSGAEWLPVKSVNVDTEFNLSSFEQFLMIAPIPAAGSNIIDIVEGQPVYKTQFLLPSTDLDRFFINGTFTNDYERVSNVAIQYPSDQMQGKVASAIHVNPNKLVGITKKLIAIDKANPVIAVSELNTEFYGLKNGAGHLLLKTGDSNTEYISVANGIKLSPLSAIMYDYVLAISYRFKDVKQEGSLSKGKVVLSGVNSVYIGTVSDPICVFVQGIYLDEDSANYQYDSVDGYLKLPLESKLDAGVISFPKKEIGTITSLDGTGRGIITKSGTYTKPLLFVYGETLRGIADYIEGVGANADKLYVTGAQVGWKYAIVETMGSMDDSQMWVKSGVMSDGSIPCGFDEIPGDVNPIVFANGLLVSQRDVVRDTVSGSISCIGMTNGMEYVLLKDPASRLVYNDYISFTTVPTGPMDTALVYVQNQLICDSSAVYTTKLPTTGDIGEVRLLINGGTEQWYKYESLNGWRPVLDATEIQNLNGVALGYSTSKRSISILQNFGAVDCVYYAYSFANAIEETLLRSNISTNDIDTDYQIAFNHTYPVGKNALSVWLDGIRQYPDSVTEVNSSIIRLEEPVAANLFYIIERPERSETKSCQREILTPDNRVVGAQNVYQTTTPLFPGNVRVFISGYRQPPTAYKIIDAYTIMLTEPIVGSMDNYPVETVEVDGEAAEITHTSFDKILIEVRQDFNLREITLPIRYAGQKEFSTAALNSLDLKQGGDGLPRAILDSKDFIMIYINGAAYGKEYVIDPDKESIVLLNENVTSVLGVDYLDQYFKNNPDKYLEWQQANGYAQYTPKPITDKITFEWR